MKLTISTTYGFRSENFVLECHVFYFEYLKRAQSPTVLFRVNSALTGWSKKWRSELAISGFSPMNSVFDDRLANARQRAEADALRQALAQCGANLSQTAKLLGISRPTLYRLLRQHGISTRRQRQSTPVAPDPNNK